MNRITRREFLALGAIPVLAPSTASGLERRPGEPLGAHIAMQLGRPALFVEGQPSLPVYLCAGPLPRVPLRRGGKIPIQHRRIRQSRRAAFPGGGMAGAALDLRAGVQHRACQEADPRHSGRLSGSCGHAEAAGEFTTLVEPGASGRMRASSRRMDRWNIRAAGDFPPGSPWNLTSSECRVTAWLPERWLDECGAKTRELCQGLASTPEGEALFCVQVAAGVYGEWHYYGFIDNEPDTGPAMTSHFRRWLGTKYGTDQALQRAWNDPTLL